MQTILVAGAGEVARRLGEILSDPELKVESCTMEDVVRIAEELSPDAVVLSLPHVSMDLMDMVSDIRMSPRGLLLPVIIFVPEEISQEDESLAIAAGSDAFFHGMESLEELAAKVHRFLCPEVIREGEQEEEEEEEEEEDSLQAQLMDTLSRIEKDLKELEEPDAESVGSRDIRLEEKYRQACADDYYMVLEVEKDARAAEVERAGARLLSEFAPQRWPRTQTRKAAVICRVVEDAIFVLGDRRLAGSYLRGLQLRR